MSQLLQSTDTTFVDILNGEAPGMIIAQDAVRRFAIIENLHPEAGIHWLAIPYEPIASIEDLEKKDRERFLSLVDFAISETKAQVDDYPELEQGFTIKFHYGAFETVPHAKLHILSSE